MLRSIQEFLRKINSHLYEKLTFIDFMAIIGTILLLSLLFVILLFADLNDKNDVLYSESTTNPSVPIIATSNKSEQIIASRNGKTYYYSWCSGVERIKYENRIVFQTDEGAKATGRTLASGCK